MALKFCPTCGELLIPEKKGEKFAATCGKCGFSRAVKPLNEKEKIRHKKKTGEGIAKGENPLATYHNKCPKCGYDKAQIIDMGIFYSDEDNLIMLKCGKCGYSERVGRKTS
jgi:DNA-directed RNA polymerase subunit M/transcription elongation factor TFIIS